MKWAYKHTNKHVHTDTHTHKHTHTRHVGKACNFSCESSVHRRIQSIRRGEKMMLACDMPADAAALTSLENSGVGRQQWLQRHRIARLQSLWPNSDDEDLQWPIKQARWVHGLHFNLVALDLERNDAIWIDLL